MKKILIFARTKGALGRIKKLLPASDYQLMTAADDSAVFEQIEHEKPDIMILEFSSLDMPALSLLKSLKQNAIKIPVIAVSSRTSSEQIIAVMKHGAYDFIEMPADSRRLTRLIDEAAQVSGLLRAESLPLRSPAFDATTDRIVGKSILIQEVSKMIGRIADSDIGVLLRGESGTGKELVARAIYRNSRRAGGPFLAVNCAAIPETLLESELFGYERGAFTGAMKRKSGKFEQVEGGTIFLDEIGDMSMATQAKILRVLQEGTFERLGGEETIQSDVRIIAATNQNLEQAIAEHRFREDLYYRIKVITITLPPLRLHKEDIDELVDYFLEKYAAIYHNQSISVSDEAMQILKEHDWPGNIRELENSIKRAILLCKGNVISAETIRNDLQIHREWMEQAGEQPAAAIIPENLQDFQGVLYDAVVERIEKEVILAALRHEGGNQVRAAQLLGISRVMLHDRIEKYGIKKDTLIRS